MAITASTLTTIAVFFPMIFASGITGKMTQALGLSITFSLLASLFVALTIVPLATSLLFRSKKSLATIVKAPEERQFAKAKALYRKWLNWALHHRRWVLGGTLLALLVSLAIVPFLGTEFMPAQDMDMIMLKVRMPVGHGPRRDRPGRWPGREHHVGHARDHHDLGPGGLPGRTRCRRRLVGHVEHGDA